MMDVRDKDINVIPFDGGLTILKGGLYMCTIIKSAKFGKILAGHFSYGTGFTPSTLREIADIIDTIEEEQQEDPK